MFDHWLPKPWCVSERSRTAGFKRRIMGACSPVAVTIGDSRAGSSSFLDGRLGSPRGSSFRVPDLLLSPIPHPRAGADYLPSCLNQKAGCDLCFSPSPLCPALHCHHDNPNHHPWLPNSRRLFTELSTSSFTAPNPTHLHFSQQPAPNILGTAP